MNTRNEYLERMLTSPQFRRFEVVPKWRPGEKDINGFIHDEVVRQWHDPRSNYDGGRRIKWMDAAWSYAINRASRGILPDAHDIVKLGMITEPEENRNGFRQVSVFIGHHQGAPWPLVPWLTDRLVETVAQVVPEWELRGPHTEAYRGKDWSDFEALVQDVTTVTDWYAAYEAIHPFGDGNGRTGKILSNWLAGTLDDPVLVPDLYGTGNP